MPSSAQILFSHLEAVAHTGGSWESAWEERLGSSWIDNVGGLLDLYDETVRAVTALPPGGPRPDILLRHAPEWRRAIVLHGVQVDARPRIHSGFELPQEALDGLYSVTLALGNSGYVALHSDVDNLRTAVDKLHDAILAATDLAEDVRDRLLRLIVDITWAIDHRNVVGDQPLRVIATTVTGEAATNPGLWRHILQSRASKLTVGLLTALGAYAGYVNDVGQAASTSYSVIEHIVNAGMRLELMAPAAVPALEAGASPPPAIDA